MGPVRTRGKDSRHERKAARGHRPDDPALVGDRRGGADTTANSHRACPFIDVAMRTIAVGDLWTIDTYSLQGRIMQSSKDEAAYLYKKSEYEIWKLRYYYSR